MVVGGGIAGMQASLDAAAAGYKVYLVERDISIGGVMAQLDKTFPTNDCSTCLISPKLIEVAQHPDIEILTQAEIERLEGEAGHFTVTLHREPRYIDAAKCNACGACAEVCPVSLPSTFDEGMGQRHAAFRHFPQAVPSTFAIKKFDRAPCVRACPANLSAQGYVQLIKAGKYNESLKLIMDRLPLPGTIGRICPHPCESDCRRQEMDEPVAICSLKRFAADQADWDALPVPEVPQKNQAVAIVGAGPAGLSCAYHLALKGYRTVIFEAAPEAGGWLRYGIPEYRLPREVFKREVDYLTRLGVEIRYNSPIGEGTTIDDLLTRDGFAAVFLGVGTQDSIRLPVPGAEAAGVLWGVEYLKEVNSTGQSPTRGKRVAVIGGGNVAMDVARVARRQGAASVSLIALESAEELPASPWEVAEARAEGIEILHRLGVKQILAPDGQVTGLELRAVDRVFDEAGRFAPAYFDDRLSTREADVVIMAIGQKADLKFISPVDGINLTPRGLSGASRPALRSSPSRYRPMEMAASRPAATAPMAIQGPVTTSPPAKTPAREVARVSGSVSIRPRGVRLMPSAAVINFKSAFWPMAMMTTSASRVLRRSSKYVGAKRPASSKTRATALSSRPVTWPSGARICLTPRRWRISMPSALASATSQGEAGSSSGDSRAMRLTEAAPCRRATRATSMATLPPPMTITRLPWVGDLPVEFTSFRYSTPHKTPAASAPGTGRRTES